MARTLVIGTGTWGTAAAVILHRQGHPVCLWGRDAAKVARMAERRRHPELPDLALPDDLQVSADAGDLAAGDLVLWAVPTQHSRSLARQLAPHLVQAPLVSLAKGIEEGTLATVCGILGEVLPGRPLGVLSGPSHAVEIIAGKPVCLVAAGEPEAVLPVQARMHGPRARIYTSPDRIGVELAGALKNVVAIAAGMCDGLGAGDNLKAALVARGLAEMRRLGRAMGAAEATFAGLAGVGDLLTTCYAPHGRNRALGVAIAKGGNPLACATVRSTVAEGAWTCRAAEALGRHQGVELPITSAVAAIIWAGLPVPTAVEALFTRTPKDEDA